MLNLSPRLVYWLASLTSNPVRVSSSLTGYPILFDLMRLLSKAPSKICLVIECFFKFYKDFHSISTLHSGYFFFTNFLLGYNRFYIFYFSNGIITVLFHCYVSSIFYLIQKIFKQNYFIYRWDPKKYYHTKLEWTWKELEKIELQTPQISRTGASPTDV